MSDDTTPRYSAYDPVRMSNAEIAALLNEQDATIQTLRDEILKRAEMDAEDTHRLQAYCSSIQWQLATAHEALGEVSAILQQRGQDGWEARILGVVNAALKGKAR